MEHQIFSVAEGEPPPEVEAPAAHANALVKVRGAQTPQLYHLQPTTGRVCQNPYCLRLARTANPA